MGWMLQTTDEREDGVFGELYQNGELFCKTLEHAYPDAGGHYLPKLPRGYTYKCVRGWHQLEHGPRFETFEITGVPGHSGILFHIGNFNRDSNGCCLLGASVVCDADNDWCIERSTATFQRFMAANADVDEFDLEVN